MPFRVEFHVKTDVGTQRTRNEDCYLISPTHKLAVVADGMGGHHGGDIASDLATRTMLSVFEREDERPDAKKASKRKDGEFLRKAIAEANTAVYEKGSADDDLRDMGTTVVSAWIRDDYVVLGSVGDSRIYRMRDDAWEQVTVDHSWVAELKRRRLISEDEAASHPLKNIITRALGMDRVVNVDIRVDDVHEGDVFVLCSDGLTDFVPDAQIHAVVREMVGDLDAACHKLVDLANEAAGADNITVGIVRVVESEDA